MGTDAMGWVEVYDEEDDMWDGIICASTLLDRDYDAFAILFGVRNKNGLQAIAPQRGLPENLSPEVENDLKGWLPVAWPTWITWQEIKQVESKMVLWSSWKLLFELMTLLAATYGDKNVRLTVWFD